jgi:N-acetyl-gamma-glutamyl-phosphate reductase
MTKTAAVAGATGYAGGELLRLLCDHPEFEIGAVTAARSAGDRLGGHQPQLPQLADRIVRPTTAEVLADHDVVFLALPHGVSAALAAELPEDVLVVDCGADHRLREPRDWADFYTGPHAGYWPYGLPELPHADGTRQRELLPGVTRVAVPGCYPTAATLALAPGFTEGLLEPDVVVVAASGTSGAGRSLKTYLLGGEVMGSMTPYAVAGTHRHTPEMEQNLRVCGGGPVRVSFTPTRAPMPRGILATCTARLGSGSDPAAVRRAWERAYGGEPFVRLLEEGRWPRTADTLGANTAAVQVAVDARTDRVIAICAIDNLTKGTAGGAIQSANLALGLEETMGLPITGMAP